MKIAYRYILRELMGPMVFGVAAFVSILVAGRPLQDLMKLAFQGVEGSLLLRLFLLSLPPLVVLTLPMSVLLATLLGFGRLSGDSEMVAMYAGGLSVYRAAVPVFLLSLVVAGVTVTLNERVTPWSIDQARALRERVEGQVKEQKQVEIRLPQFRGDKLVGIVRAESLNPRTGELLNISATDYVNGEPARIVYGRSAVRKDDFHWTIRDGWYRDPRPGARTPAIAFGEYAITVQQTPEELKDQSKKANEMSMAELRRAIGASMRQGVYTRIPEYEVAWWNRWAMPFASVVFALIGLPLALRPQRTSSGLGLGLSIVIIFLYWVVWYYTGNLGAKGLMPPFLASWLANILGVGIGGVLLARAPK